MNILVTAASKYGATAEIAEEIGNVLRDSSHQVTVLSPEQVGAVQPYDAVVLGSAVYAGHWLEPARNFAEREASSLTHLPVWLFSSGPIGEPAKPDEDPVDVAEIERATGARDHRVFPGKLDRQNLSFVERALTLALRAPTGDFRDWDSIRTWARGIAGSLASLSTQRSD